MFMLGELRLGGGLSMVAILTLVAGSVASYSRVVYNINSS